MSQPTPENIKCLITCICKYLDEHADTPSIYRGMFFPFQIEQTRDAPWVCVGGPLSISTNNHAGGQEEGDIETYKLIMRPPVGQNPAVLTIHGKQMMKLIGNVRGVVMAASLTDPDLAGDDGELNTTRTLTCHVQALQVTSGYIDCVKPVDGSDETQDVFCIVFTALYW